MNRVNIMKEKSDSAQAYDVTTRLMSQRFEILKTREASAVMTSGKVQTRNNRQIKGLVHIQVHYRILGHAVAQLVEALRYKSEGHGFDFRWCHWNFSLT
jgi:hypothetical protein